MLCLLKLRFFFLMSRAFPWSGYNPQNSHSPRRWLVYYTEQIMVKSKFRKKNLAFSFFFPLHASKNHSKFSDTRPIMTYMLDYPYNCCILKMCIFSLSLLFKNVFSYKSINNIPWSASNVSWNKRKESKSLMWLVMRSLWALA